MYVYIAYIYRVCAGSQSVHCSINLVCGSRVQWNSTVPYRQYAMQCHAYGYGIQAMGRPISELWIWFFFFHCWFCLKLLLFVWLLKHSSMPNEWMRASVLQISEIILHGSRTFLLLFVDVASFTASFGWIQHESVKLTQCRWTRWLWKWIFTSWIEGIQRNVVYFLTKILIAIFLLFLSINKLFGQVCMCRSFFLRFFVYFSANQFP